jgi:hypothetical protein
VRFILVGGNETFDRIVAEHTSLLRHLTLLSTEPLSGPAIRELLDSCAERCGFRFTDDGRDLLEEVACGSPYHARLFGMHSTLAAFERGETEIHRDDVVQGLANAFAEWARLNPDEANSFREILAGLKGDPARHVAFARQWACSSEDRESQSAVQATRLHSSGDRDQGGPVIVFRDPTAPQFLIALQQSAAEGPKSRRRASV